MQQEVTNEEEQVLQENWAEGQNQILIEQNKKESEIEVEIIFELLSKYEESKEENKKDKKKDKKAFKGLDFGKLDDMNDDDLILDGIGNISIFRFRWSRGKWG